MGSGLDYLRNITSQFAAPGIRDDDDVTELPRETEGDIKS